MVRDFFQRLFQTKLGLAGAVLTTGSGFLIIAFFAMAMAGLEETPYLGILAYLVLPAIFLVGLLLMPLGTWLQRRRGRRGGPAPLPVFDLNEPRTLRRIMLFGVLTAANVIILAAAGFKGVEVMDRSQFCGSCHSVMDPEYTAYTRSPHSRVACVQCHIGPGASWFVKSKLSGAWQVVSVNLDLYPRPIPTPVENLRPSRDTCEQCHWPTKFVGDRLKVLERFADDEQSTPKKTVLLLHVGGGDAGHGIHWHVSPGVSIRYLADRRRETVRTVEVTRPGGAVERYDLPPDEKAPAVDAASLEWRTMDCVDCHNRPTHQFRPAAHEVDAALAAGRIDRSLPFVRREAMAAVTARYADRAAARAGIRAALSSFYEQQHPAVWAAKKEAVLAAADVLAQAWAHNVWPQMNIEWGTYPSLLGHEETPGCWRCHDDKHATAAGKTISQDCETCHAVLADGEEAPEILKMLGQ